MWGTHITTHFVVTFDPAQVNINIPRVIVKKKHLKMYIEGFRVARKTTETSKA